MIVGSYLVPVLDYATRTHKIDIENILLKAGIDPSILNKTSRYLNKQQYVALISSLLTKIDRYELLRFCVENTEITQHGVVGLLTMCGTSLGFIIKSFLRFYTLQTRLISFDYIDNGDKAILRVTPTTGIETVAHFTVEITLMIILKTKKQLLGLADDSDIIHFTHTRKDNCALFPKIASDNIHFGKKHNQIIFPKKHLALKLKSAHKPTYDILEAQCETLLKEGEEIQTVRHAVEKLLTNCDTAPPNLEQAASQLAMSSRNLSRQLKKLGTSYKQLVDTEIISRSKHLLANSDFSITQIAYHLYFKDVSHFSKVFKRHTKKTPAQYRQDIIRTIA